MSLVKQYFIGLTTSLLFLGLMYSFKTSKENILVPTNTTVQCSWQNTDVETYVNPTKNFVQTGTFGTGDTPDHIRTIGYPFLIAVFVFLFKSWLIPLLLFQCALCAFIYPITSLLCRELGAKRVEMWVFWFLIACGAIWVRSPLVLTDVIATLFFLATVLFGIRYYRYSGRGWLVLYLLFATITALIRPIFILLPVINICIAAYCKNYGLWKPITISLILIVLVGISAIRNQINYGLKESSSISGINAFEYFGKDILKLSGNDSNIYDSRINYAKTITEKTELRNRFSVEIATNHPIYAMKVLSVNAISLFLQPDITTILSYFNKNFTHKEKAEIIQTPNPLSITVLLANYLLMFVYLIISIFFIWSFFRLNTVFFIMMLSMSTMILLPAVFTGHDGSRFRLPLLPFVLILSFNQMYLIFCELKYRYVDFKH